MKRTWAQGGGLLFVSIAASCVALDWNFEGSAASSGSASGSSSVTSGNGGAGTGGTTSSGSVSSSGSGGAPGCPVAGMVECGGLCVDLTTNGSNCGACGHSCQGQSCAGSICAPVTLASNLNTPWGLAVDSTTIYWLSTGAKFVETMPIGGAPIPTPIADGPNTIPGNLQGIAVQATEVFWTDHENSRVRKAPISGAGPTIEVSTGEIMPYGIVVDASFAYWTALNGTVKRTAIDGSTKVFTIASGQVNPSALTVNASDVYWATDNGIMKTAISSLNDLGVMPVVTQAAPVSSLAMDATHVYWTTKATGKVMKKPLVGGVDIEIASGQLCPGGIAVDADSIYWLTAATQPAMNVCTGNAVMKYPKASGPGAMPVKLAAAAGDPGSIALDANSVYWEVPGTGVDGFILRTSK